MHAKPLSYPFLKISKDFDVPYEDVLLVAHAIRGMNPAVVTIRSLNLLRNPLIEKAVGKHCTEMLNIQEGKIDWMTGERRYPTITGNE